MEFNKYGTLSILFINIILSYAIVSTRLMDIEVVIKKGIVYAALTAMLTVSYFSIVYLSEILFRGVTGYSSLWIMVPAVITLALLFQPTRDRVQKWVDKSFFRFRYDYQQVLSRYSKALRKPTTDLNRFLKIAPYLVAKSMQLSGAGILVLNRNTNMYDMRMGQGEHREAPAGAIDGNFEIVKELLSSRAVIVRDEVEHKIRALSTTLAERERLERIRDEMSRLKASLLIPSVSESEYFDAPTLISIFVFGPKLSEDQFSGEDIDFLLGMARRAAIIIEYAFILEELKCDEQKLVQTEKFAALGVMAGSVVGALRGPIENMEDYSREMMNKFGDPVFRDGFVNDIPRDIMRLDKVVNDLLVYARPMKLEPSEVRLNDLVNKAVALLKIKQAQRSVEVKTGLSKLPVVMADAQHLLNALVRLVSFSIAASPKQVWLATGHEGQRVYFSIAIPGAQVPSGMIEKIFVSYYSPREGEPGLELATAARIIREHGGDIAVKSDEVMGTTFTCWIPSHTAVPVAS